ncbi:hypothetical protein [Pseudaminobacter soli (ex Li et al. 2025)]|uniref:Uncharacterized protein n=1 Tax=Pseudaminobacter soli (ex Li et al. 2025) TaxID=1295366 RepID=A0A2P7S015_9HYPH|nr:hypothetical protein [Mesorhizobium soli]PSJ55783.1 hypothetical protein C7I85_26205 [Mesorhizobium soli]
MSAPANDFNDVESEIGHLAALIGTITDIVFEMPGSDATMHRVGSLLWIARDLSERLVETTTVCNAPMRMAGGQRS